MDRKLRLVSSGAEAQKPDSSEKLTILQRAIELVGKGTAESGRDVLVQKIITAEEKHALLVDKITRYENKSDFELERIITKMKGCKSKLSKKINAGNQGRGSAQDIDQAIARADDSLEELRDYHISVIAKERKKQSCG